MADQRYLTLQDGTQTVFITGIKYKKAENDTRASISIRATTQPTSVSYTAPFTNITLQIPSQSDEVGTKILFEQKIKAILYPLSGKGAEEKVGLNTLYQDIKATFEGSDVEAEILVTSRDGNSVDAATGAPRKFYDVVELKPLKLFEKAPYNSDVDFDEAIED